VSSSLHLVGPPLAHDRGRVGLSYGADRSQGVGPPTGLTRDRLDPGSTGRRPSRVIRRSERPPDPASSAASLERGRSHGHQGRPRAPNQPGAPLGRFASPPLVAPVAHLPQADVRLRWHCWQRVLRDSAVLGRPLLRSLLGVRTSPGATRPSHVRLLWFGTRASAVGSRRSGRSSGESLVERAGLGTAERPFDPVEVRSAAASEGLGLRTSPRLPRSAHDRYPLERTRRLPMVDHYRPRRRLSTNRLATHGLARCSTMGASPGTRFAARS